MQPLPKGPRVGIVTNSGGPGILATDACVSLGLEIPELSDATKAILAPALAKEASLRNPVDMIASAGPDAFRTAVAATLADPGIDALLVLFITPVYIDSVSVADAIVESAKGAEKPVLCCFMGKEGHAEAVARLRAAGIPVYQFPESPAHALATMVKYRAWLERDPGSVPELAVDAPAAQAVIDGARAEGRLELTFDEGRRLVEAYGFPFAKTLVATTLEEVIDAGDQLGFPLVVKAVAPTLSHKSDRGGVKPDLRTLDDLVDAQRTMKRALADIPDLRFMVQRMAPGDREVILGVRRDPDFGPLLMFGLGGIHVEVLKDVAFRVHPITDADARDMIRGLRGHALLAGTRGKAPVPEDLVVEMLLRLDKLVGDHPEIAEMDLNPIMLSARAEECLAVDVRVSLTAS